MEVGGERHRAAAVILNVGARPVEPAIPGLRTVPWLDNRRVMQLRELPSHLVVIGGGYIGCELAQAYRRFGSAVTIVEPGAHLLGHEDVEASEAIEGVFRGEGIALLLGARAEQVSGGAGRISIRMSAALPGDLECRELVELVTDYLEDALAPEERTRFEQHLAVCPGCAAYLRQLRAALGAAGRLSEDARSLPDEARDRLLTAFRDWKRRRPLA